MPRTPAKPFVDGPTFLAYDGGVTHKSLRAWEKCKAALLQDGYRFESLFCNPKATIKYGRHISDREHVVTMVFRQDQGNIPALGGDEPLRSASFDGFSWGYGGEGPRGLATMLADLLVAFGHVPSARQAEMQGKLSRYVASKDMESVWGMSLTELLELVAS